MTLVIGLAYMVSGCVGGEVGDATATGEIGDGRRGLVTWVDDGDSIEVEVADEVIEVRLVAVNTPDRGECFADRARDHLIETLRDRPVQLQVMGEDQFGRTLAHVFEGERHVNVELIEMGLALASTPGEGDPNAETILAAEEEAYRSSTGLWSTDACGWDGPLPAVTIDRGRSTVDPEGPDEENLDGESLVILNDGHETIDLTGWIIRDESTRHRFRFAPAVKLGPRERVVVASSDTGWAPGDSPVWNNSGDMALLQLPDGTVVSRWRY